MSNDNDETRFEVEADTFTDADRSYLRQFNANEKPPKLAMRKEVAPGLELVGFRYQSECWTLTGNPNFPKGLTFDVREIKNAMALPDSEVSVYRLPISQWLYDKTVPNCDEPYIQAIDKDRMDKLGIIIMLPDQTICMIDGNHRLCARWRAGLKDMRVAIINFDQIKDATFVPGTRSEVKIAERK